MKKSGKAKKNKRFIKSVIKTVKNVFKTTCPECNGELKSIMLDMKLNKMVYKCKNCGQEFI